jgi:acetyl esterase/lipase
MSPTFPREVFKPDDPRYRFADTISSQAAAAFAMFYTYYSQPAPIPKTQADWDARYDEIEHNVLQMSPSDELTATSLGGVSVIRVPGKTTGGEAPLLLYIHGGGHTWLSARSTLAVAKSMSEATGYDVVSVDYTVAPRGTWQTQTREVVAVYQALLALGHAPARIGIFGDSAGGGLCCGAALRMRDEGLPLPGALLLLSPWSDISGRGDSYKTVAPFDPILTWEELNLCADAYAAPADQRHPYVSPVYGDYSKPFPPTLIQGGTRDLLLSDSVRLYRAILAGGNEAILDLYEGMAHAYHTFSPDIPEVKTTYTTAARFWRGRLG